MQRATAVIFWKLDRASRQGLDGAVSLRKEIRDAGAKMLFATLIVVRSGWGTFKAESHEDDQDHEGPEARSAE